MDHDEFDDDFLADEDEFDAGDACGRWDNGKLGPLCSLAGTEFCEWECPFSC